VEVDPPFGRKLKQDRAKLLAQSFRAREKVVQRILRFLELLIVRQKATGLYGEFEVLRRGFSPRGERLDLRQHVKAVVDLDRIEPFVVAGEHLRGGKFLGIERAYPMLVMPPGSTYADVRHGAS